MPAAEPYREWRASLVPATMWTAVAQPGDRAILPDGSMDLIWDGQRILVAGADRQPNPHRTTRSAPLAAIRFDPGVAPAVLGIPADELTDRRVDLADVWPSPLARQWADALAAAAMPVGELERLAAGRLTSSSLDPGWAIGVTAALRAGHSIDSVADEFATGSRQLHRRSQAAFGYGPKLLQRILRVTAATDRLRGGYPLTAVAADTGFADYSHMFRDFRAITGHPPSALAPREASIHPPGFGSSRGDTVSGMAEFGQLPGAELVERGLADLGRGDLTVEALLVAIGAPRLRDLGVAVPSADVDQPEHRLYALRTTQYGADAAHSYNALIRRFVSFERAAACVS